MKIFERLFPVEEINGGGRCPTYLYRRILLTTRWFNIYLHHFVGDDWSLDLHDHPKRFISIGLWGGYYEESAISAEKHNHRIFKEYRAPWFRTFPASHIHRLSLGRHKSAWTLVVTLKAVRSWGFWHWGQFIPWRTYVGSEVADQMKSCAE